MSDLSFEFELYRLRLEKPRQGDFFLEFEDRSSVIVRAIRSKPSTQLRQTVEWNVGNVTESSGGWLYFFIGKSSLRKREHFDEERRDFIDQRGKESPYTYCLISPLSGIVAIAKRSKVAANTRTIASRLEEILKSSPIIRDSRYEVVIKEISDPFGFMQRIRSAHAVKRFKFFVSPTNPLDIEGRFHQPNKDFVDESGAREGEVSIKGDELRKDIILATAASVNAVGDDAIATIQEGRGKKVISIHLRSNPAKVRISEDDFINQKAEEVVAETYSRVRGAGDE